MGRAQVQLTRREVLAAAALGALTGVPSTGCAAAPDGQLTWGVHISLAPIWFDPADISGIITPFMVLYALHDALVKTMPGRICKKLRRPAGSQACRMKSAITSSLIATIRLLKRAVSRMPATSSDVMTTITRAAGMFRTAPVHDHACCVAS